MQVVIVKPVEGRLILMPERAFQPVPDEGARVYKDAFYTRAILQGDLSEHPDEPEAVADAPVSTTQL